MMPGGVSSIHYAMIAPHWSRAVIYLMMAKGVADVVNSIGFGRDG